MRRETFRVQKDKMATADDNLQELVNPAMASNLDVKTTQNRCGDLEQRNIFQGFRLSVREAHPVVLHLIICATPCGHAVESLSLSRDEGRQPQLYDSAPKDSSAGSAFFRWLFR